MDQAAAAQPDGPGASRATPAPEPARYNAKKDLLDHCKAMRRYGHRIDHEVEEIAKTLARAEWEGRDTSFARATLLELRWRTNATSDLDAAEKALRRLKKAVADEDPPNASTQDESGSFAPGTTEWFLKLDRSTDQLLAREWPWRLSPYFLEKIDDPVRLYTYLTDLSWCDVRRQGVDTRKELNLAISVIARLALRGGQGGYLASPGVIPTLESFVRNWRDENTGFFGVKYVIDEDGNEVTTKDLSLTFHMVRYLPHLVTAWPVLVETLLRLSETPYPQGRVNAEPKKYSDHNNYDVAEILRRGWAHMEPRQRVRASDLIGSMLDWCLKSSVTADGEVIDPDTGDMVPDAYYFCAAFLDTVGFFDRTKRFWTAKDLGNPKPIQDGMRANLARFNPRLTVVANARERLDIGQHRAISSAVL